MAAITRLSKNFCSSPASALSGCRFLCTSTSRKLWRGTAQWVLLGPLGVGRATYAHRLSRILRVPHISVSDLVRDELKNSGFSYNELLSRLRERESLDDETIMGMLFDRIEHNRRAKHYDQTGFLLHGFPYSIKQAVLLEGMADIDLVVNLKLPQHVLVQKHLGHRVCGKCSDVYNVASIDVVEGEDGSPAIHFDPVLPPVQCIEKLETDADYAEEIVKKRLSKDMQQKQPVLEFYRAQGKLLEVDLSGGVSQSWPKLLQALNLKDSEKQAYVEESAERRVCGAVQQEALLQQYIDAGLDPFSYEGLIHFQKC